VPELDPEDAKLITLARATRARTGADHAAAVRDLDGRTYAAAPVELPSLSLTALQVAVAMAVSSSAAGLEAAAVVGETSSDVSAAGVAAVSEFAGTDVTIVLADVSGAVTSITDSA
jgi:cytidine deaminase